MTVDLTSLAVAGAVAVALVLVGPLARVVLRRRGRTAVAEDLARLRWPGRAVAVALVARVAAGLVTGRALAAVATAVLVAAVAWALVRASWVAQEVVFRRLHIDVADNLRARSRRTQLELVRRLVGVVVVVGALVVALFALTPLSEVGPSLVAYASLIGVVLGLALRTPLENLVAGVLVAVTEPIRLDDVVVVEEQWGRIEQIGLANVTVRIWDDRRLVLPTSRFVNEPFENWTRRSSAVLGTVLVWADPGVDVDDLRAEVQAVVRRSPQWDGRATSVQVVDAAERAVQVRVLVSAADASDLWDLRCAVREHLVGHLARRPGALAQVRLAAAEPAGLA